MSDEAVVQEAAAKNNDWESPGIILEQFTQILKKAKTQEEKDKAIVTAEKIFKAVDTNKDNLLNKSEFETYMEKMKVLSKTCKNSVEKYKHLCKKRIKELTDKYTINIEKIKEKNVKSAKIKFDKLEAFALLDVTKNLFANDKPVSFH